jgi:Zn-dependent protease
VDINTIMQTVAIYAIPVLLAITIHEAAHGYAARHFGDNTAWLLGRITLNPFKHIDPIGTIAIPLLLLFATSGAFLFGYAKPVPVNFGRLRRPKRDMVWVALAGPASNVVQAMGWVVLGYVLAATGTDERFLTEMVRAGVLVNLVLFALNMFPLPPLDGGRIAVGLLPMGPSMSLQRIEPFGFWIVLGLLFTGLLGNYWLRPLMRITGQFIDLLLTPVQWILL